MILFNPMTPQKLNNTTCNTGENPLWHPDHACVYYTDIPAGLLYRYSPATQTTDVVYRGDPVGGFTRQSDGSLLLFRVRDIARFDPITGDTRVLVQYTDETMARFNDVHADPVGRVYAGTIGRDWKPIGGLYLVDLDGSIRRVTTGSACSNGMAFSPDESTLYWHCSSRRLIFAYDYVRATGDLRNERVFYSAPADEGTPDGTAMDERGNLYSCRWDGSRICVIDPTGTKIHEHQFPVAKVSCATFGGPHHDELFVTTAGGGRPESSPDEGALFSLRPGVRGRAPITSRILLP
jgi:D-xylonolactonase